MDFENELVQIEDKIADLTKLNSNPKVQFDSEIAMTWTLDYELIAPLSGLIDRPDDTEKLTARSACQ